jgi:flagellar basal-body rod protein FlgF
MDNALLIGLSKQVTLRREMDMLANNLANMNTVGFKSEKPLFEAYLMPVAKQDMPSRADSKMNYVWDYGMTRDFSPGPMLQSNRDLDLAIEGNGWFSLNTPQGERYSRNGAMEIDAAGFLVNNEGYQVLGENGAIQFSPDETNITFARDGSISTSLGEKGKLKIVRFDNLGGMEKVGNNMFTSKGDPVPSTTATVAQGMIEKSNVRPVVQLTRMMEVTRAYTSLANVMERQQDMRTEAIRKLAEANPN